MPMNITKIKRALLNSAQIFKKNPMRIIVGLGNPGEKYTSTRHNAGFLFVDVIAKQFQAHFKTEKNFKGDIATLNTSQGKVLLVKPSTFMNNAGEAVSLILNYYKLEPDSLVIVHDDIDLAANSYKITPSSRAAGHNGVQNIIDVLGTQDFTRVRLGVGRPTETLGACMPSHDYVLAHFSKEEIENLTHLFPEIIASLDLE